eukprot:4653678-Pleurochrysis_carterae.AAC.1
MIFARLKNGRKHGTNHNQILGQGTSAPRSDPTSLSGETEWKRAPEPEALGPPPTDSEALGGSVLLAKPGPPSLEILEAYGAVGPDITPTLLCGTSGLLLPSFRPLTAPTLLLPKNA